jgi:hypothetical protein
MSPPVAALARELPVQTLNTFSRHVKLRACFTCEDGTAAGFGKIILRGRFVAAGDSAAATKVPRFEIPGKDEIIHIIMLFCLVHEDTA